MIVDFLTNYTRGWIIGDFAPSIIKTKSFEIGILFHPKGEQRPPHFHSQITEYNILVSGKMKINNKVLMPGTIFIFEPYEIANPEFLDDCMVICVKIPSIPDDKHII